MLNRRALMGILTGMAVAKSVKAQDWPNRPIRFVIPSAPGGGPDTTTRVLVNAMQPAFPRGIVLDNRPGASGTIGLLEVARAAPDGHVIGYANIGTLAINQTLLPSQPYDVERDFAAVALLGFGQSGLVTRPNLAVRSVAELIALAKREPGTLTFASPGNGTTAHLGMELFRQMTGTDMLHIPYRGSTQAHQDLLAGRVDIMLDNLSSVLPHVRERRLPILAVSAAHRSPQLPDVPTIAEAGVAGFDVTAWGGIVAPAATPAEVVERLNREVNEALRNPTLQQRLEAQSFEIVGGPPAALFDLATRERPRWADIIRRSGARID